MSSSLYSKMTSSAPRPWAIAPAAMVVRVRNELCAAPLAGTQQPAGRAPFASESTPGALPWLSISEPRLEGHLLQRTKGCCCGSGRAVERADSGRVDAYGPIESEGQEVHADYAGHEDREDAVHGEAIWHFKNLL